MLNKTRKIYDQRWLRNGLRIVLWFSAFALCLLLWQIMHNQKRSSRWKSAKADIEDIHFYALDQKQKPYHIHSKSIVHLVKEIYHVQEPSVSFKDKQLFHLESQKGIYDHERQILRIFGRVRLFSSGQYNIHTTHALMNLCNKKIDGNSFVWGGGPLGQFQASGFVFEDNLHLKGPAHLYIPVRSPAQKK